MFEKVKGFTLGGYFGMARRIIDEAMRVGMPHDPEGTAHAIASAIIDLGIISVSLGGVAVHELHGRGYPALAQDLAIALVNIPHSIKTRI